MALAKQKFSGQADPTLLKALRKLAKTEGRQLHSLIDEALHDLVEKHTRSAPREHVMAHYKASLDQYDLLYKRLADRSDRPWGSFDILLDQEHTKVKRLTVRPGHRLSLQSHQHRDEHWVVVRGIARVTLDDATRDVHYGEHVFVKRGVKHRIANLGREPVELIEVQTGDAFPEEDIVRYEDDYNRA